MNTVRLAMALLAAGVVGTIGTYVQAAPPSSPVVTIGNVPLPVTVTLDPYQEGGGLDAFECQPQCILSFSPVPAGKRLVLTHISAQLGDETEGVLVEGPPGVLDALYIPKPYPGATFVSAPITFYYEAGETPTARMFVPSTIHHTSLIVTLVGYLAPAQ